MLRQLTERSFSPYGRIYEDSEQFWTPESGVAEGSLRRCEAQRSPEGFRVCDTHAVYCDFTEGMTALCVYDTKKRAALAYYLDKPVSIRARVPFCLLELDAQSAARLYVPAGARLRPYEGRVELPPLTIAPRLGIQRVYTLFVQEKPKGFFFRGEQHAAYELTFVEQGSMHCIVGGRKYSMHRHDLLLCLPGQWHIQYADPDVSATFVTVSFDMACEGAGALAGQVRRANDAMRRQVGAMLSAQRDGGPYSGDRILQALGALMLAMLDDTPAAGPIDQERAAIAGDNHIVEEALHYIESHMQQPLTVAQLAASVCVSPSYLAVLFRRHLSMTPTEALRRMKLEEAARLLRRGDLSISQVSQRLGFATLQHFSRCYKAYFGQGPRQYLRSAREQAAAAKGGF